MNWVISLYLLDHVEIRLTSSDSDSWMTSSLVKKPSLFLSCWLCQWRASTRKFAWVSTKLKNHSIDSMSPAPITLSRPSTTSCSESVPTA